MKQSRRKIIQGGAALAVAGRFGFPAIAQSRAIKLGYVSPATGPLAPFGEADKFVIGAIQASLKGGLDIGGHKHPVEIIVKDSQSNPNRAGEVAADLILKDRVDMMVVGNTPETANPVSDQCELNEVPCVSSLCPWQPWFFGRKGDPAKGFNWTYHFF
jgi:branched-chain amino acid transport system substrate-binding protein